MAEETILFEIVTPSRLTLSKPVAMVVLPGEEGHFGVLPRHAPLLSSLRPGVIEIYSDINTISERYFVDQGFADVTPERCTVLAEEAIGIAEIARTEAEARLRRATDALLAADTPAVRHTAERDVRSAEAMIEALELHTRSSGGR